MKAKEAFQMRVRAEGRFTLLNDGARKGRLGLMDVGTPEEPDIMCCLFVIENDGRQYMLPLARMLTSGPDDDEYSAEEVPD